MDSLSIESGKTKKTGIRINKRGIQYKYSMKQKEDLSDGIKEIS